MAKSVTTLLDRAVNTPPATEQQTTEAPTVQTENNKDREYIDSIYGQGHYDKIMNVDPQQNVFEQIYKSTTPKPKPISERGLKNARLAAGIGEGLGTLAEMYGASRGARVSPRDYSNGPIAQQTRNEKDIRNIYDQQEANYQQGELSAKLNDYQAEQMRKARLRSEMTNALQARRLADLKAREEARADEKWLRKMGLEEGTAKANQAIAEKRLAEEKRKNKAQEEISKKAVESKQNKTNYDMELVTKVRSLPVEWQKKMGFLKPVSTEDLMGKKTEWTFDNSIRPEVLEAAVKEYEKNPTEEQPKPTTHVPKMAPVKKIQGF